MRDHRSSLVLTLLQKLFLIWACMWKCQLTFYPSHPQVSQPCLTQRVYHPSCSPNMGWYVTPSRQMPLEDSHARCYMQDNSRTWRLSQRLPAPPRASWCAHLQHPDKVWGDPGAPHLWSRGTQADSTGTNAVSGWLVLHGTLKSSNWRHFAFLFFLIARKATAEDDDSDAFALAVRLRVSLATESCRTLCQVRRGRRWEDEPVGPNGN